MLPVISVVYKPEESPFTFGLGIFEIGGFGVNYPDHPHQPDLESTGALRPGSRPALYPAPALPVLPDGLVQGPRSALSRRGGQHRHRITLCRSGPVRCPCPGNHRPRPAPIYPSAVQGRTRFGGGFQLGVYYIDDEYWSFGASVSSPQWFEPYTYQLGEPAQWQPVESQGQPQFPAHGVAWASLPGVRQDADRQRLSVPRLPEHQWLSAGGLWSGRRPRGPGLAEHLRLRAGNPVPVDRLVLDPDRLHVQHESDRSGDDHVQPRLTDDHHELAGDRMVRTT